MLRAYVWIPPVRDSDLAHLRAVQLFYELVKTYKVSSRLPSDLVAAFL